MVVRYARGDFCISQEVTDSAEKLVTSKFVLVRVRVRLDSTIRNLLDSIRYNSNTISKYI